MHERLKASEVGQIECQTCKKKIYVVKKILGKIFLKFFSWNLILIYILNDFYHFQPFSYLKKKYDFNEKKQWKKQDLNLRSSGLKLSAIPTELSGLGTDYSNILLYLLIHHQNKHMKSKRYTIYHEIFIYAKSPHPNSVLCLNL